MFGGCRNALESFWFQKSESELLVAVLGLPDDGCIPFLPLGSSPALQDAAGLGGFEQPGFTDSHRLALRGCALGFVETVFFP